MINKILPIVFLTALLLSVVNFATAQDTDTTGLDPEVFTIIEDKPVPQGGIEGWSSYLQNNLKYPTQAKRMGVEGTVYTQFIVEKDGTVSNVRTLKGIGNGCDEEALRVISNSPPWQPGRLRDEPKRVRMVIPIVFKLSRSNSYDNPLIRAVYPDKVAKLSTKPTYKGGMESLNQYLEENIQQPADATAIRHRIVATVRFTITKDGSVANVTGRNTVPVECSEAAENIIRNMPAWNPGLKKDRPVSTDLEISIVFNPE